MNLILSRRKFLSTTSALCLSASAANMLFLSLPAAQAESPVIKVGKEALKLAFELFMAYVGIQSDIQTTKFTEGALLSIESKFETISQSITRIESEIGELKHIFLQGLDAAFLRDKISTLRAKWGVYRSIMGSALTLPEIASGTAREKKAGELEKLKFEVKSVVEDVRVRAPNNPIVVTPIFSAFSLLKAINERLVEAANISAIFGDDPFVDESRLQKEYDEELSTQFGKWRAELMDSSDPHSLDSRQRSLRVTVPRAKAAIATFEKFGGTFQSEFGGRPHCPGAASSYIVDGVSAERLAGCLIARANSGGLVWISTMRLVLVDTWVRLTSARACMERFFPAELFDVSVFRRTASVTRDYDSSVWNDPNLQFKGRSGCEIKDVPTIEQLEKMEQEQSLSGPVPASISQFEQIVRRSNSLQTELVLVLSAWEFASKTPTVDARGNPVIGVSYQPDLTLGADFGLSVAAWSEPVK